MGGRAGGLMYSAWVVLLLHHRAGDGSLLRGSGKASCFVFFNMGKVELVLSGPWKESGVMASQG